MAVNSHRFKKVRVDVLIRADLARDSRKGVSMPRPISSWFDAPPSGLSEARRVFLKFRSSPANPLLG